MKQILLLLSLVGICLNSYSQMDSVPQTNAQEMNKEIAKNFYYDLWFTNNTGEYSKYVADEYIIHDIGKAKNLKEEAIVQKEIADLFWSFGELSGEIDYQIAEGDLVATRWHVNLKPNTFFGRLIGMRNTPIINVFRIKDEKIVEIWNHRHDIDISARTLPFLFKGLLIGLLIALIPTIIAFRLKRKLKAAKKQ